MGGRIAARVARRGGRAADGQGLVGYARILVPISVVAIGIMATIGGRVWAVFAAVSAALS